MSPNPPRFYTTSVAAYRTITSIQAYLHRTGVQQVSTILDGDGRTTGITFTMSLPYGVRTFAIPVRIDGVLALLRAADVPPRYQSEEHAERVAWRLALAWLEVQATLIDAGMATLDEIFTPWMLDSNGETFYQAIVARGREEIQP
jgi:hypothetical protein